MSGEQFLCDIHHLCPLQPFCILCHNDSWDLAGGEFGIVVTVNTLQSTVTYSLYLAQLWVSGLIVIHCLKKKFFWCCLRNKLVCWHDSKLLGVCLTQCTIERIMVWGSSLSLWSSFPMDSCPIIRSRYEFCLVKQSLNTITVWFVTPMASLPLLHQQASFQAGCYCSWKGS